VTTALPQGSASDDASDPSGIGQLTPERSSASLTSTSSGQDKAKRSVAIALRNRWRRLQVPSGLREEIMPNNIIMIGPTGVGKTEIARRLARLAGAPFIKVEASKFTEVGYVGRDVESIIRDLNRICSHHGQGRETRRGQRKAKEMAEERILDILIPPSHRKSSPGVEADAEHPDEGENGATREKFRRRLQNGEMEDRTIEMDIPAAPPGPLMQVIGPMNLEEMGINLQDLFGNLMPKKLKRRKVTVAEARLFLTNEEAQKTDRS